MNWQENLRNPHTKEIRAVSSDNGVHSGLSIDLRGKRAFIVGIDDDNGYGWEIAKSFAIAGAEILVGTWVPTLNIFETSLKRGKFDESCVLPNGSLMEISKSCFATLPLLYLHYTHQYSHLLEQDPLSSSVGSHPFPHSPRVASYVITSEPHFS